MFNLFGNHLLRKEIISRSLNSSKNLPKRGLKLHEYQAGKLLKSFRVPIPLGQVAFNGKEAFLAAKGMTDKGHNEFVVKA